VRLVDGLLPLPVNPIHPELIGEALTNNPPASGPGRSALGGINYPLVAGIF